MAQLQDAGPGLAPNGKPLAEVYRAAAARVRRGWAQNFFATTAGGMVTSLRDPRAACFCALGALLAEGLTDKSDAADVPAGRVLAGPLAGVIAAGRPVGERDVTLVVGDWNDEPERTADEVASALEVAAAKLEGGAAK